MFNYNHLFYFYSVVKEGGISAAARKLSISQPALSAQIRQLEKFFGKKLFSREGKGIRPTEFGLLVFSYTQKMFELSYELLDQVNKRGDPKGPLFHVGISDDLERSWVADTLTKIFEKEDRMNQPQVILISGPHEALETKLRNQNLDVILSFQSVQDDELEILESIEMPVMLGVPSTVEVNAQAANELLAGNLNQLFTGDLGLAVPSKTFRLRDETESFLKFRRMAPKIIFEGDVLSAVTLALESQQGAALLPLPYMQSGVSQGYIKIFGPPGGFWRHRIFLMIRKSKNIDPVVYKLKYALIPHKKELEGALTPTGT